jgi:hypothetical protein
VAVAVVLHIIHHQSAELVAVEAAAVQQIKQLVLLALQILVAVVEVGEVLSLPATYK